MDGENEKGRETDDDSDKNAGTSTTIFFKMSPGKIAQIRNLTF